MSAEDYFYDQDYDDDEWDQPTSSKCKFCGKIIFWPGPLNGDGTKHDCMLKGSGETAKQYRRIK